MVTAAALPPAWHQRRGLPSLLLFVLGGLTGWAHAPLNLWMIPFLTFPAFLHLLAPLKGWRAYYASWVFAFGYFVFGLYWIASALFLDIRQFWWALPLAVAGLPSILAAFQAVAGWTAQRWASSQAGSLTRLVLFVTIWSTMEYVRGHIFTGFPWLMVGELWVDVPWARALAGLGGAYTLSLWAVMVAVLPAAIGPATTLCTPHQRRVAALSLALLLGGAFGYGTWTHARFLALQQAPHDTVRVEILQPNIAQDLKQDRDARDRMLADTLLAAATAPLVSDTESAHPAHVVVWPESAVPYRLENDPALRRDLAQTLPPGAFLLTGVVRRDEAGKYYNSLVALDERGALRAVYDKAHLVPFGEYIPLRSSLPFDPIAGAEPFTPGSGPRTLHVENLPPFSPLICYEAIFPAAVVDQASPPRWLVNITNDGWYGLTHGPYQHLALARLRAVEEGLPLVRAANTGISALISPTGEVLKALPLGQAGRLGVTVHLIQLPTPYSTYQDALFFGILTILFLLTSRVRR